MSGRRALPALVVAVAILISGYTASAGATTQPTLVIGVKVTLAKHSVTLSRKSFYRGYYVRFGVRNATATRRRFTVAGRTIAVPPRKLRLLALQFDMRGRYSYVSRGAGTTVRGSFRVS